MTLSVRPAAAVVLLQLVMSGCLGRVIVPASDGAVISDSGLTDAGGTDALVGFDANLPPPQCLVGLISDDPDSNLTPLFALIDAMPDVGYDHMFDNVNTLVTADAAMLGVYDVVVFYNHNRSLTGPEATTLEAWIQAGGRLLVTGHDSLGDPDDTLLATLVRSTTTGDVLATDLFTITDDTHPIANGPFGALAAGTSITSGTPDQDAAEADLAAGAITVAELSSGHDKIIATELPSGGIVVYWNGNGASTGANYDSPDWAPGNADMRTLVQNTLSWMCTP